MARPLRIEYEDAFYHVMNRGRGRQWVFHDPAYYNDFLKCLNEANKRFGVEVHSYCLMGNHYHLFLKTPRGNLSRIMRHIDGVYTQRHNRRKRTDGTLFRGRYKAIVIDAGSYRVGNVVLQLKSPYRDGTTHIVMSPLEFMQRLAALVPRPRLNLIRFHGSYIRALLVLMDNCEAILGATFVVETNPSARTSCPVVRQAAK